MCGSREFTLVKEGMLSLDPIRGNIAFRNNPESETLFWVLMSRVGEAVSGRGKSFRSLLGS